MVADVFEKWVEEADIDGFNMACKYQVTLLIRCAYISVDVSNPDSYETAVELLVPELQRRGLMWEDYEAPGGTFRENLYGTAGEPYLPQHHPGSKFKWNSAKSNGTTEPEINTGSVKEKINGFNGVLDGVKA